MSRRDKNCVTPMRVVRPIAIALSLTIFVSGCSRKTGPIAKEQTSLSWLGSMYGMYISQNHGKAPKTIDELHKFVEKATTADKLARLNVTNVNDLFISPRDNQPFALVSYDKFPAPMGGNANPVVLYEVQGQSGEHAVALLGGGTKTVDDNELQSLLPAKMKFAR
jgi:hypothetical protein